MCKFKEHKEEKRGNHSLHSYARIKSTEANGIERKQYYRGSGELSTAARLSVTPTLVGTLQFLQIPRDFIPYEEFLFTFHL